MTTSFLYCTISDRLTSAKSSFVVLQSPNKGNYKAFRAHAGNCQTNKANLQRTTSHQMLFLSLTAHHCFTPRSIYSLDNLSDPQNLTHTKRIPISQTSKNVHQSIHTRNFPGWPGCSSSRYYNYPSQHYNQHHYRSCCY